MRLRQLALALALTVLPTATLLAALEDYNPSGCVQDRARISLERTTGPDDWVMCHMSKPPGTVVGDYSMQANLAPPPIPGTRFHTCSLTIENGIVPYLEFGLVPRSGVVNEHAKCNGVYPWLAGTGARFLRCRTSNGHLPASYTVDFTTDGSDCL